ncbi:MAG: DUF4037 domain-containing protein [Clostridia bacterium]|nr:DUF4037 domain-containing protein [Clostridia bacterium]
MSRGIELSERFYLAHGEPMLREQFPELCSLVAVGLLGSGSECFGYDDEISRDHDFEAGFCLILPDESLVDRKQEFALERAYAKLPREFEGVVRSPMNPVGGNRHGVIRLSELLKQKTGREDGVLTLRDWFFVPEQSLLELTNGRIFRDDLGALTSARERLSYFPEDVRRKKLAGKLLIAAQSGQYNYARCVRRGERAAAQLALFEFVQSIQHVIFLLNRRYLPYYKWSFRALRELPLLSDCASDLEFLISSANTSSEFARKQGIVEEIAEKITKELCAQNLSDRQDAELEAHAYAVNDRIANEAVRNLHILSAV